ncbi:efflux RND transporter periplasmic adaptor subunit [Pseudomonas sp. NPDC007930]|uniref:efflux RND transporter periplasmic adaptor subunit n=1 Tax=Pseudomonas sp. NPDC007930 TaxID=3364417 RepID=UPI0036E29526
MRPPKRLLAACAVLLAASAAAWWYSTAKPAPAPRKAAAIPVKTLQVRQADVPRLVAGIGTVQALQSVTIRPQVDGILAKVWVREGQFVEKGQRLASLDDRALRASLDQALAQRAQTQAQLKVAQVDLKRYQALSQDDGISRQQLDGQQALYDQLKATLLGNDAAIAAARVQLSYTQIASPLAGRVGIRNVDEGNFLRVSDTAGLFSVTQLDPISVTFSLPQAQLPTLQQLLKASPPAPVSAFSGGQLDGGTPLASGHLSLIDNQVSSSTGTVRIKAEFANPDQALWPGQLVNVRLQTQLQRGALLVPSGVVQRGIDGTYLYRLNGDRVESVPVKVLDQSSDTSVISGVDAGDTVISDGQSRLKPGSQVEVTASQPEATRTDLQVQP